MRNLGIRFRLRLFFFFYGFPNIHAQQASSLMLLLLWILIPFSNIAQNLKGGNSEMWDYRMEEVDLLEHLTIMCIAQGPQGYLWIGTQSGLYKFDGHSPIKVDILMDTPPDEQSTESPGIIEADIRYLYWGKESYLWICTQNNGLIRFDPKKEKFKQYLQSTEDKHSISYNLVVSVVEDQDGTLWVGTFDGLNRFDRKTERFERFLPDSTRLDALSDAAVRYLYQDKQENLWISTGMPLTNPAIGGLYRYHPETSSFTRYFNDPKDTTSLWHNGVRALLEDRYGNFWVTTAEGLQRMDRSSGKFERMHKNPNRPYAPTGYPYSLLEDQSGNLWIGTHNEDSQLNNLLRYNPATRKSITYSLPINNRMMRESNDGTIWIAPGSTGGAMHKMVPYPKRQKILRGQFVYPAFRETALYRQLNPENQESQLMGPYSMTFDPDDQSMWLRYIFHLTHEGNASGHAILLKYDKHTNGASFYYLDDLPLVNLNDHPFEGISSINYAGPGMAVDQKGRIWGTYPAESVGVFCFDPETGLTKNHVHIPGDSTSLMSNYVIYVMQDSKGDIWAAQYDKGISRLNLGSNKWIHFRSPKTPLAKNSIGGWLPVFLKEDQKGQIWTGGGSVSGKAFISTIDLSTDSVSNYFLPNDSEWWNVPRYLAFSGEHIYFPLYDNGLGAANVASPEIVNHFFPNENNFPLESTATVVADKDGALWIASRQDNRFVRLNPDTGQWMEFEGDNKEPALGRRGMLGPDGRIYFLHLNEGWTEINPKNIPLDLPEGSLLKITDLFLDGERQSPGNSRFLPQPIRELDQLRLTSKINTLAFRFSSFYFRSPKVVYYYRLYPYETDWNKLSGDNVANYKKVPTGNYTFELRAFNVNGASPGEKVHLSVIILPPWWKTGWAFSLYTLFFLLLLLNIYLYQRRRYQLQARIQLEQERADRLKEMDQFKSRFYTNITHEFRTPLTVIKGMTDQISGHQKIKTIIQRNSDQLLNMVNQLLDLSKLESNSLPIHWVQADIIPFLQYLTESCHSVAEKKKLNLAFFSKEDQLIMDFDDVLIQQILINLLSNAIKFTPEYGSVKVIAAKENIEEEACLELTVKDTGKGIPVDQLPFIFDRFYQADDSTTRRGEGSGIGLALVKELVQLLNGKIELESVEGKGSSFVVYLPIHHQAVKKEALDLDALPVIIRAPKNPESRQMIDTVSADDEKPQVLVIEDNTDVTEYILSCLAPVYALQTACDGREGLEKALEYIPDVILCDIMMPEMDGFEVCRRLKEDKRSSHIPIVLLTAKATQEDKIAGLSQGADAYLTKPFDKKELRLRLHNLIAQSQRLRNRLANPGMAQDQASESELRETAFLQELDQIIAANLDNDLFDTNYLCRAIAMSRAQLYRKIKALTGQSTAQYIRLTRLNKAKSLLETSDLPVGEIALQVGYKDFSHFSRSFLKEFDLSPSELRK